MDEVIVTANGDYSSKAQILEWINEILKISIP